MSKEEKKMIKIIPSTLCRKYIIYKKYRHLG
jgi:hypothetical protein